MKVKLPAPRSGSPKRVKTIATLATAVLAAAGSLLAPSFLTPTASAASGGDLAKQQPKWKIDKIPDAPVLSPADEAKTFKLPPGFKIELVAAEPVVEEPIALTFDPDGRMYVVQLRAYMPDAAGTGELDPIGRVSRLESTKGDGVYDKSVVFIDKLKIPRAVGLAGDGVLVSEPPNLYFCRDTDGDGKADTKDVVATDYASLSANPEHMANGLVWMLDNWCYSANYAGRFKYVKGKLVKDGTMSRGQWGIAQDDRGRLFYNSNSAMLRHDAVPAQYLNRNPYLGNPAGVNVSTAGNAVFTSRVNPGVNRGYTGVVGDDGFLKSVTAACGPQIYRGAAFPEGYQGNAFVCEPAGNVVIRHTLAASGLSIKGTSVQHPGGPGLPAKVDFLTSTDERFRPVSLYNGPDGALYLIDLYHGILQHKAYLSAYLDDQVKQRNLANNDGHKGRIWRIVPENYKPAAWPKLSKATTPELVATLSHPNGWWRDTAQRLLVERQDMKAVTPLLKVATGKDAAATPLAKLHAIWTLQGLERLEDETVAALLTDKDPQVRVQALRAGELLVRKKMGLETLAALPALANDPDPEVLLQVVAYATPDNAELQQAANGILAAKLADPIFRSAALSAAAGRELELLESLLTGAAFAKAPEGDKKKLFNDLAECVVRGRTPERIDKLFAMIADLPAGKAADRQAMLSGVAEALTPDPKSKAPKRKLRLPAEPAGLAKLKTSPDKKLVALTADIDAGMSWPDKPGDATPPLKPLSAKEAERFAAGRELYTQLCGVCHQPSGLGMEGVAPRLVDSEWALGTPERPVRIVLHGLTGPIKIGKQTFDSEMPGLKALEDEQIASVLTYIRREWGHESSPVDPKLVAKIRKETADRGDQQWMADELSKIK
jgi:mono/diheme cytochrome c family protein/glucose/arabinose dehydrogenase